MRLLCIGGTGQNGATLLSRMLGQLPGFVAVGEIGRLWDKGLIDNVDCGCGQPFSDCPFWTEVGRIAFGDWKNIDPGHAVSLRTMVERQRRHFSLPRALPLMLTGRLSPRYQAAVNEYAQLTARVYGGVQEVSGADVIVDSMKIPQHIFAMRRIENVQLQVIHLVRDSRGVAYSSLRRVPRQGGPPGALRDRSAPLNTAVRWMWTNLSFHLLARLGTPTMVLRYEDLIASPHAQLLEIARLAGRPVASPTFAFLDDDRAELPPDHLVAGNRMRLTSGRLALRIDDEWRTNLAPGNRRIVSLVTWPLQHHYSSHSGSGRVTLPRA